MIKLQTFVQSKYLFLALASTSKTPLLACLLWWGNSCHSFAQNYWAKEYFQRGEIELYLGDNKQAITQYNLAIQQTPTYAEAYFSRGRAYLRLKENQKAAQDFYETLRLQPRKAEAHFYLGAVFQENQEFDRALECYNRALDIDNTLPIAYNYRAEIYRIQGLTSLALEDYNKAIQFGGRQAPLFFGRGKCLLSLQKHKEAIEDFTRAIELEPRQILYYQYRLEANFVAQNFAQTAQDLEHIKKNKSDGLEDTYKSLLVFCYLQAKDCQNAVRAMEALPAQEQQTPKFLVERGKCYEALNLPEKALADYQQLLIIAPDSLAYHKRCMAIWWAGKKYEKIIQEAIPYLEKQTQDAEVWYWKGFAHFALNHQKEFRPDLQTALFLGYKREDMDLSVQPYVKKIKGKKK
jgi:tetratricopeptide (TPR) repeat protein